jgi:CHASE1-domain containing sensor protein
MIVRHWFPVIAGGVTLALLLSVVAVYTHRSQNPRRIPAETIDASQPAQTEEEYQSAIRSVLATYEGDKNAEAAYDTLLYIARIPGDMKDVHIGLVGAFGKLAAGNKEDGERRLEALRIQYSWLVL